MASIVDTQNIRKSIGRFRVLIIGRANAGKTTILQKVCNTTDKPEIYNSKGDKINTTVEGSIERGNHDIRNEMVFKSKPGFGFFDSCGFEAGSEEEFEDMKKFLAERVNATKLEERIHAIWYCIPMDESSRTIQRAEEKFFSECNTGNVPIIVVFTKFDALRPVALGKLKEQQPGLSRAELLKKIAPCVEELFNETGVWDRLCDAKNRAHPKNYVKLEYMNKPSTNCDMLVECTTLALDDEELRLCLVSTQQSNLELCIKCAIETLVDRANRQLLLLPIDHQGYQLDIAKWFSHLDVFYYYVYREGSGRYTTYGGEATNYVSAHTPNFNPELFNKIRAKKETLLSFVQPLVDKGTWFTSANGIIQTGIATIIVLEYSAFLQCDRELKFIKSAVDYYMKSPTVVAVEKVAREIADGNYKKEERKKKILEFVLENRLSKGLTARK